jgi:glycosyltransferase involved in cell wall biosynthesis
MSSSVVFSVIVPTFNRPAALRECISALARQTYPRHSYEVIVADDGGTANLDTVTEPFSRELAMRVVRQENSGPGRARNLGASIASGRSLAFTDDDCQPDSNWLAALEKKLMDYPDRLVGGLVLNALDHNPYAVASQMISDVVYAHYNRDLERPRFFSTNNIAVSAALFHEIGGFNKQFQLSAAEDRDFADLWQTRGFRLAWAPDAVVHHAHLMGLPGFWRQHFTYGRGAFQYHENRRARGHGDVPFEGVGFHFAMVAAPFRRKSGSPVLLSGLTALSQVAVASGYIRQALSAKAHQFRRRTAAPAD